VEREKIFHSHFSKIEYTSGGEKKHLTFADTIYGPDFEPVAEIIAKRDLAPTIICESSGTQAEDSHTMKKIYENTKKMLTL
jgi:deoxyribonuclease-4